MAKASWLNVVPSNGSGNGNVSVSTSSPHTGRNVRNTVVTFKAAGVDDKEVTVNQAGKPEFVDIQKTAAVSKAGNNITISGTSNSRKLNFTLGSGALSFSLPNSYLANSLNTTNNNNISGDPGATREYNFSIELNISANLGTTELTRQLVVTANGNQSNICTITQAAGDPTLSVSPTSVELDYEGTAKTITVISNTTWTVE